MILDIIKRSLSSPSVLIAVEELIAANSQGSRMPDVDSALLSASLARRVVDACCTSALAIDDVDGRMTLSLNYGDCIGCGRCIKAGESAFFRAERLSCCGVSKQALVRRWDVANCTELRPDESAMNAAAKEIRAIVGGAL